MSDGFGKFSEVLYVLAHDAVNDLPIDGLICRSRLV